MVAARRVALLAAALLPGAAALRTGVPPNSHKAASHTSHAAHSSHAARGASRQQLDNLEDMQYYGDISIGGQTVKGILDTGSFEIVAFSKTCPSCGIAGKYNERGSKTYKKGTISQEHAYGSGSCWASDGFDAVSAGIFTAEKQALWIATECQMPLLAEAKFNAIVGLGPPGEPVITATQDLQSLQSEADAIKNHGGALPKGLISDLEKAEQRVSLAKSKPAMLENFGVSTFSECLGKAPGSPGWLVWNDVTRAGQPGVQKLHVGGNITWGVDVKAMKLGKGEDAMTIACSSGCASIVDTGTSLFAVPTELYNGIFEWVSRLMDKIFPDGNVDCSSLKHFPDLHMTLAGQELTFPPSSYVGKIVGQMNQDTGRYVRTDRIRRSSCQLLFMDIGFAELTPMGPLIILGMPFFRQYYTTFDLGSGRGDRALFVSQADDSCTPGAAAVSGRVMRSAHDFMPREVDASQIRVPHWVEGFKGRL